MIDNEEIRPENARAESQLTECQKLIECLRSIESPTTPPLPQNGQVAIAKYKEIKAALIGPEQTYPDEPKDPSKPDEDNPQINRQLWILPKSNP